MPFLSFLFVALTGHAATVDQMFALSVNADGVNVSVRDRGQIAAHHVDHGLLVFMTTDGRLYAADVRPRLDGTLPDLDAVKIADLHVAMGDLSWWTALIGTLSAAQAAGRPDLTAGDIVVGKQDFDGPQLVQIIPRAQIESEIECARALSFN